MRGRSLARPRVLDALAPFIVASWNGSHETPDDPTLRRIFSRRPRTARSNVIAYVLDSSGDVLACIEPFANGQAPERQEQFFLDRLREATRGLDLPSARAGTELHLPDVESGLRIYVQHADRGRPNYDTPVVATVPWPVVNLQPGTFDAADFRAWWDALYPPAMMEYRPAEFTAVSGTLTLRDGILRGRVRLSMSSTVALEGDFEAVLLDGTLRGVFEGRHGRATVTAAFESRPQ